jgi:hypothetical protein
MNSTNVGATMIARNMNKKPHISRPAFSGEQQQQLKKIDEKMEKKMLNIQEKKQLKKRYFRDDAEYIKLEQDELWAKKLYTIFEKITSDCSTICPAAKKKQKEWAQKKQEYETIRVNYEKKHWNEKTSEPTNPGFNNIYNADQKDKAIIERLEAWKEIFGEQLKGGKASTERKNFWAEQFKLAKNSKNATTRYNFVNALQNLNRYFYVPKKGGKKSKRTKRMGRRRSRRKKRRRRRKSTKKKKRRRRRKSRK